MDDEQKILPPFAVGQFLPFMTYALGHAFVALYAETPDVKKARYYLELEEQLYGEIGLGVSIRRAQKIETEFRKLQLLVTEPKMQEVTKAFVLYWRLSNMAFHGGEGSGFPALLDLIRTVNELPTS